MVCGRPSSASMKSSLVRLLTICPFLSRTVANTLTTFTSVEKVVSFCASCWADTRRSAKRSDTVVASISRREIASSMILKGTMRCLIHWLHSSTVTLKCKNPGGHLKQLAVITSFFCLSLAPAQDKMLPLNKDLPTIENTWDLHYTDLEPVLVSRLAETPDSLEILDELPRVYRGQAKYDQAAKLYRHALELREAASGRGSIDLVPTLENLARIDQLLKKLD